MISLGLNRIILNSKINSEYKANNIALNKPSSVDTVTFTSVDDIEKASIKMRKAAINLLENDLKLQPKQSMVIRSDKKFLPFLEILSEEAYKRHSGHLYIEINEPELDALKEKHCKYPDFEWKKERDKKLIEDGALFVNFDKVYSPYKFSNLNSREIEKLSKMMDVSLPGDVQDKVSEAFNPEDVFKTLLNIQQGQPIRILAEREHEPQVLRFVEYAYKHGSGAIDVDYTESGAGLERAKLANCDIELLENPSEFIAKRWQEMVDKKTARLTLRGGDPKELEGIDPDRVSLSVSRASKIVTPIKKSSLDCHWSIYYLPTTMSAKYPYPEIDNKFDALKQAAIDAKRINRCGKIQEHVARLNKVADLMNSSNFDQIHFFSVDPKTGQKDDKTDLFIGLTDKARFMAAVEETSEGLKYIPNTPTEEVFSSPDKTRTEGWVSSTMPLSLNGNIVEGIRMRFENGKAVEIYADKNQDILRKHIENNENADMLGEVALVAGSPIFDTGRIFNDTLLDENAACHIAIGSGFSECTEGANDIKNYKERQEYLKNNNVNICDIHNDFMIGGPNVVVEGITKDGKAVTLIKNNKFQI